MRAISLFLALLLCAAPALADEPSVKEGFDEVGRAIADETKEGVDATKNVGEKGWDKTREGVGTALEKTGEGFDKAAEGLDRAGDKVKE